MEVLILAPPHLIHHNQKQMLYQFMMIVMILQPTPPPFSRRSTTQDPFDPNHQTPQRGVQDFIASDVDAKHDSGHSAYSKDSKVDSIAFEIDPDALEKSQDAELPTKYSFHFIDLFLKN